MAGAESDITTWAKVVFSIPSDLAPGTYTLGVEQVTASDTQNVNPINGITSKQVTLTVTGAPAAEGYTVAVSGNTTIQTGEDAQVKLNITHSDANETSYAAYSMKVSYNKDVLAYKDKSFSDTDATVTDDGNGTLTIYRYGKDLTLGGDLILTFTGKAGGTSEVKVTEAKVDKSENALQNALKATVTGSATITVGQTYQVTLPDNATGAATASSNQDYTFKLNPGLDGNYMNVKYKIGNGEEKAPTRNADGSYTIPKEDVTGDITITAVGQKFDVTVNGTGQTDVTLPEADGGKATYGTDYKFTVTKDNSYAYDVKVAVNDTNIEYTETNGTYSITGTDITGAVTITVNKTLKTESSQITIEGTGSGDVADGTTKTAEVNKNFEFTINEDPDFTYTVTAKYKDKDDAIEVISKGNGKYLIEAKYITGDEIIITVAKTAKGDKYTVEVSEYVKLDGKTMFLVTAKLSGSVTLDTDTKEGLTYGGNAMFLNSEEHYGGAYSYLVISSETKDAVLAEAKGKVAITTNTVNEQITIDGDVNGTGLVDINDAQLVYNIYNTKYDSFDTTTMKMFLAADVNNDKTVSSLDAAAVVASIK